MAWPRTTLFEVITDKVSNHPGPYDGPDYDALTDLFETLYLNTIPHTHPPEPSSLGVLCNQAHQRGNLIYMTQRCPIHNDVLTKRPGMFPGGFFYAGACHERCGCAYSLGADGRHRNHPSVVSRASVNRSQGTSLRAALKAALVGQGVGSEVEVEELMRSEGVMALQSLLPGA